MKIERATLREIRMPLVAPFETSFGRTTLRRILLLTLTIDGVEGWGEVTCGEGPYYNEEFTDGAVRLLTEFALPLTLSAPLGRAADLPARLGRIRGNRMALAAIENAAWAAEAQMAGVPLWRHLGGVRAEIACGVSLGIQATVEALLERIRRELAAGYQRIKVKIKPGWDVAAIAAIRSEFPSLALMADANSAYTLDDLEHLRRFDDFGLTMIEQPMWHDDFYQHARLQAALRTPVCLDEAIHHARDARAALELGACRVINLKLGRVGGFSSAREVHDAAQAANAPVWCGGMLESGVGRAHNIAMSTWSNFRLPGDVSASRRYWQEDIIAPEVTVTPAGTICAPESPGLGFEVKRELVERLTAWQTTLRPA